jgi:muramoyltetrapeptide carboxypeptidase
MHIPVLKIALVSPSSPFEPQKFYEAVHNASNFKLDIISESLVRHNKPGFLNGTKKERLKELFEAERLGADALWCTRGGFGALELWHDYNPEFYANKTEPLIGYSDATILHFMRFYRAGRIGIHGPMFLDFCDQIGALRLLIENKAQQIYYPPLRRLNYFLPTHITGSLVVMNLISLQSLVGSFDPSFLRGKILALEEVKEPAYKIFRALWQLKNSGALVGLKALLIGHMPDDRAQIIQEIFMPLAQDLAIPLFDWPVFGHEKPNWPLLFGARISIRHVNEAYFTLSYNEQLNHQPIQPHEPTGPGILDASKNNEHR